MSGFVEEVAFLKSSLAWCSCRCLLCIVALATSAISCGPSRTEAPPAQPAQAAAAATDPDYCATTPTPAKGAPQAAVAAASVASRPAAAPPKAASIEQGRVLFMSYGCAACHGKEGRGDGIVAQTLDPRPRNFHDPSSYRLGASAAIIARTIGDGIKATSMPAYPSIPAEERAQIASYIVSLQKKH